MKLPSLAPVARFSSAAKLASFAAAALTLLGGCASTLDEGGLEQRTAQAVGRPAGQFSITDRHEESGGRLNYTVNTRDGSTFRCYLYGPTGFQKAMSFGQTPHSDAVCTAMVGSAAGNNSRSGIGSANPSRSDANAPTSAPATAPAAAPQQRDRAAAKDCNALLRAAGRC